MASRVAHAAVLVLVNLFVGSLYALPQRVRDLPRNHGTHVAWRIGAVACVCAVAPLVYAVAMYNMGAQQPWGFQQGLGAATECNGPAAVLACVFAMQALFLGPLVDRWVDSNVPLRVHNTMAFDMRSLRDFVVAPFAEEWVFRFTILPIFLAAGNTVTGAQAQTAMWFGLAHVHHYRELRRRGATMRHALTSIVVQLTYTSVFAWLCGHFAVHTGSLLGATLMHSLANSYGLPHVDFLFDLARGQRVARGAFLLAAHAVGIALFVVAWRYVVRTPFACAMVPPGP